MKIAFLGKGGSGKSTLSIASVLYLSSIGKRVLAIDADHNMDMTYGLGIDSPSVFIGSDPGAIKRHIGADAAISFRDAAETARISGVKFAISPPDAYTQGFSVRANKDVLVMTAGPHTDAVRGGGNCSHSLAAPLKIYLPLLELKTDEYAIVDERAGTDPVATGILQGTDMAFIVLEPTVQSVRVAKQISSELDMAAVPYDFIVNKYRAPGAFAIDLPRRPVATIPFADEADISAHMRTIFERSEA